jgi:hypothetical protein
MTNPFARTIEEDVWALMVHGEDGIYLNFQTGELPVDTELVLGRTIFSSKREIN